MTKLNFKEIINYLKIFFSRSNEHGFEDYDFFSSSMNFDIIGLGNIKVVYSDPEIDEQSCHKVFYFEDHEVYIRFSGNYYSYVGLNFDGLNYAVEVAPHYYIETRYQYKQNN